MGGPGNPGGTGSVVLPAPAPVTAGASALTIRPPEPAIVGIKALEISKAVESGDFGKVKEFALLTTASIDDKVARDAIARLAVDALITNHRSAELKEVSEKGSVDTVKYVVDASYETKQFDLVIYANLFGVMDARTYAYDRIAKLSNPEIDAVQSKGAWDVLLEIVVHTRGDAADYARNKFQAFTTADVDSWAEKGWWNVFDYAGIHSPEAMADKLVDVAAKNGKQGILRSFANFGKGFGNVRIAELAGIKVKEWENSVKAKIDVLYQGDGIAPDMAKAGDARKFLESALSDKNKDEDEKKLVKEHLPKVMKRAVADAVSAEEIRRKTAVGYLANVGKEGSEKEKEACQSALTELLVKELDKPAFTLDSEKRMNFSTVRYASEAMKALGGSSSPYLNVVVEKLNRARDSLGNGIVMADVGGATGASMRSIMRELGRPVPANELASHLKAQGDALVELSGASGHVSSIFAEIADKLRETAEFVQKLATAA